MASFDKRYISVSDAVYLPSTYVHIRSRTISENIKTEYMQYGNIEDKSLSCIKEKNSYTGQINTTFRPWESRYFLRSFFGVARSSQSDPGSTEEFALTCGYNDLHMKIANGDPNTIGVDDEFITLNYKDVLINKIDFEIKAKDYATASYSFIAESVEKINDLDVTYTLDDEEPALPYRISIVLTPDVGTDITFDDVISCKIGMNNGGTNDSYHVGSNEPGNIVKKAGQSCAITFNFLGYTTDNFALRLNDLGCLRSYSVYINIQKPYSVGSMCSFTIDDCYITETKRGLNRSRDASKEISLIGDLTNMNMIINKTY